MFKKAYLHIRIYHQIKNGSDGSCFYMPYFHVKMAPKLPHGVWIGYERLPRVKGTLMFHIYQVGGHWTFRRYLFQPL